MAGLTEIRQAIAASLDPLTDQVDGLQVTWFMNPTPTPPSLDVYPADSSMLPVSQAGWEETFIVRARVSTPDDVGAQEVLDALMDVDGTTSVAAAIRTDPTLGGTVGGTAVDERTGYQSYPGDYLGCEWRVRTIQ